MNFTVLFISTN